MIHSCHSLLFGKSPMFQAFPVNGLPNRSVNRPFESLQPGGHHHFLYVIPTFGINLYPLSGGLYDDSVFDMHTESL